MAIKDSSSVMKIIERSRLLQLKDFESAKELSEQYPDSQEFLKALLKKKIVTRWQAGQLLSGNTSFFLGKYKLVDLLGAGGMGRVFRAEHITMNRPVALKIIAKELVTDPEAQKRFLNEARAIAALNHPNIVHAYSVDKEGDRYYIVMEYVDGQDLEKIVEKEGPMDQDRVALYMYQAASALNHAHERGMIHCDIKPANLLLNQESDQIKILDMGLARFHSRSEGEDLNKNVIGTVDYMAPEVAEDSANSSPQSDIYSLGCVMYYLLTGSIPFPGDTIPERIIKHQTEEPKNPQEFNDQISTKLCDICLKMMAKDPKDRYASCAEIEEELAEWLADGGHAGESTISLDFTSLGGDSKASRSSSLNLGSRSKKSGIFGKFTKKSSKDAKDSKISKDLSEKAGKSGKLGSDVGFFGLENLQNAASSSEEKVPGFSFDFSDSSSSGKSDKKQKEEKALDDTIVASEKEMAEASAQEPNLETKNMEKKENNQTSPAKNSKLVKAVLLEEDEDDESEESFAVVKKSPAPQKTSAPQKSPTPSATRKPTKEGAREEEISAVMSRLRKGKSAAWGSGKREESAQSSLSGASLGNSAAKKTAVGAKGKKKASSAGPGFIQKIRSFLAGLSPKQRIIYGGVAGGVLLLLIVLILVFSFIGGGEKGVAQNENEAVVEDDFVEEDVSEDGGAKKSEEGEQKADGDAAAAENGEQKADGDAAVAENGEQKADGDAAATEEGEQKPDGENAAPADGEPNPDGENPAPADGEQKPEGESETPASADGEQKPDGETPAPADGEPNSDGENAAPAEGEQKPDENAAPAEGENKEEAAPAEEEKKEEAAPEEEKKEEPAPEEAKPEPKKASAEPFKGVPDIAPIPGVSSKEKTKLVDLPDAGSEVTVSLLGGDVVFPVKAIGKKQPEQTKFFDLEEGDAEGENKAWDIKYRNKDDEALAAVLSLEDGELNFEWRPDSKIPPKDLPILANCALKLEVGEKSHVLALREPIELPTIVLDKKTGNGMIKPEKLEIPFPSNDVVYVEFTRIGDFPENSQDIVFPEPTKVSDLGPKNPLKISFNFKDPNGNMQEAFFFDFVPTIGSNLTGNLTPGMQGMTKGAGKQVMGMLSQLQNPQIDLQVQQWQKKIQEIEKKLEGKQGWQREAKDTTEITQLQMQIWMVGIAKQMGDADFEFRIFAQYDGEEIDLVTSRKMSPDEMKPGKKGKQAKKKGGNEPEEDENDLGGMKF
ncbi:MAG: protein kinase [Thermoguttaceae bacterium]|nr:protein kinase [Thermoguttaceae bacterium]